MRWLLLSVCFLWPTGLYAEAKLTPKEAADGWLLLYDGHSTFGWTITGSATVRDGVLVLGGEQATTAISAAAFGAWSYQFNYHLPTANTTAEFRHGTVVHQLRGQRAQAQATNMDQDSVPAPIEFRVPAGATLEVSALRAKPNGATSLFNGKDLTGWKVFPGDKYKSTFNVTPEGWLNVKNGPGDLQTNEQWADFVLQLECISNGEHLNSGIFLRCLPGQYQQGYEAQIRNQWMGDDRTKPVDFGTGAIYRRQPARKVVSTDKEWFTLTVVAFGPRLATWVNGYPVAEFTDTRPPMDNGRNGLKTGRGHLSIQGHDPTTDLSFRNLRIVDLAPKP